MKICNLCNNEKIYDAVHQKHICYPCKAEYARKWRLKNPKKVKIQNIQQREKRKEYIKKEKLIDPNKYKKRKEAKKFCEKHNQKHELTPDGQFVCRECKRLYAINYRANVKHKLYRRLKKFSLTVEEYNELWARTDGKCYICNLPETKIVMNNAIDIAIDHCHITGKVRGLLCHYCNTGIGHFKDDIELLHSAIRYLQEYKCLTIQKQS